MKKLLGCFLGVMLLFALSTPAAALTYLVDDIDVSNAIDFDYLWYDADDTNGDDLRNSNLATESLWLNALRGYDVGDSNWVDLVDKNDPYDGSFDPGSTAVYVVLKYGNGNKPVPPSGFTTGEHYALYFNGEGSFSITEAGLTTQALSHVSHSAVPEPASMLLLGSGLLGFGVFGRKKFKK